MQKHRAYDALRTWFEQNDGCMTFERSGSRHGAWIVTHNGKTGRFESNGTGFPELDQLYVAKVANPRHESDYTKQLISDAIPNLVSMLK
jgi:hypothetical protein